MLQWSHVPSDVETYQIQTRLQPGLWLQWSHVPSDVETKIRIAGCFFPASFNGATSLQTWKLSGRLCFPLKYPCFNGATSLQTWKQSSVRMRTRGRTRFNGATSLQTWKQRDDAGGRAAPPGFNGATSLQTWKRRCEGDLWWYIQPRLQWSHVPSDVET